MGDGFEYRLPSQWVLSGPPPSLPPPAVNLALPWGIRATPSARLNIEDFFADFRLEGFIGDDPQTPLGGHYWDASPSSSISDRSPLSAWLYKPQDANDNLRGYLGIRQLTLGYRLTPDLQLRVGRHRYDLTASDGLMTANGYTWQTQFADVLIPMHWLGAELRYDRQLPKETVRQHLFSAAAWNGVGGSTMGMGQGLVNLALDEGAAAPRVTFTAYGAVRSNAQPASGPQLADPGSTYGWGVAAQFDDGIFTGAVAYSHSSNSSHDARRLQVTEDRDVGSFMVDVHPGNFRFRGIGSFLNRAKNANVGFSSPTGQSEIDTEGSVSYRWMDGLVLTGGYRGVYGAEVANHMVFLGLTTSFQGSIPFNSTPSPTPR